jgi:hypothetical protein
MNEEIEIKEKQRWIHKASGMTIRIMAISEGWCMVRYKGGSPFCLFGKEMKDKYILSVQSKKTSHDS